MFRYVSYLLIILTGSLQAQTYTGKIVRIIDGDDFLFETRDSTFNVHLYGIDAPEKDQAYGTFTIAHLEKYLGYQSAIRIKRDINEEGISALLYVNGKYINKELVKNGYAWHNKPHSIDAELAWAEIYARERKLGLWISDSPAPPWDFRRGILAKPSPTDGEFKVLVCTGEGKDRYYHKNYCAELLICHDNILVITRKQAEFLKMKPCKLCY